MARLREVLQGNMAVNTYDRTRVYCCLLDCDNMQREERADVPRSKREADANRLPLHALSLLEGSARQESRLKTLAEIPQASNASTTAGRDPRT